MGKIIAVALQKGGCGKTSTVVNIAAVLATKGKKVLIVDMDPQGNACICYGINPDDLKHNIYDVFAGQVNQLKDVIIHTKYEVDIAPSNDDLSQLDMLILQNPEVFTDPAHALRDILNSIRDKYEFIIIDLPPSLSLLTVNGLAAADEVLIPLQCEYLATSGVNKLLKSISNIQENYNPDLKIKGIVATMFNGRTNLSSIVLQEARRHFGEAGIKVFDTTINRSIRYGEAPMIGVPAVIHFRKDDSVQDYKHLTEEMFDL
ncbi:AAA family ATPase [Desulfosporosinus sp.]|uniref:ParA family protein n=1 Tax=Desulfosporosinus sp. TaxID=157907 RepID=UPI00261205D2|nr:AAA family ATPase [Desulfosporosinus sp.]